MIPGSIHPLIAGKKEYLVSNSLRLRRSNSAYLTRTPASSGNQQIMTFSWWMKIGELPSANQAKLIFASGAAGSNPFFSIGFSDLNNVGGTVPVKMSILEGTSSILTSLASDMLFRDPSAWYHCVVAIDTTQATSTNRIKLYVNGTQQTLGGTTTYGTSGVYPSQNANINYNTSTYATLIAKSSYSSQYFDGYLAEVNFIDGQALTPSSFGQTDSTTGVWIAKKYAGTYGTNGYYLKFADASAATAAAIGKDSSGNGNNFTPNGISVTAGTTFDQMTDTPTLNYAVMNPLDGASSVALTEANMTGTVSSVGSNAGRAATFWVSSGKWYWEATQNADTNSNLCNGIVAAGTSLATSYPGAAATSYGYIAKSNFKFNNGSFSSYGSGSASNGDVLMYAFDLDNGKLYFGKNGTWFGSGDPVAGTNAAFTGISGTYAPAQGHNAGSTQSTGASWNFGQRAFAYTPPTGFKALNSTNLPTPSIKKGSLFFDATTRTGTGATASVSSLNFQPDLVWIKSRSAATNHNLFDSSRGATVGVITTGTGAEYTDANSLTAFNSAGYSLGSDASSRGVNINTNTYVDWAWKKGATPGFDIVTYTGNGANRTIEHSLGAAPAFMAIKSRSGSTDEWFNFHKSLGATKYIRWGQSGIEQTASTYWNNTAPTSSVFSLGTITSINANGVPFIAYLWSEIEGFSKFGSYTGNGSTDGPFVFTGFRPRFILQKRSSGIDHWTIVDTARTTANPMGDRLFPSLSIAGDTGAVLYDILSNGFKLRTANSAYNGSGETYIFVAYAENPFKYARAR